MLTVTKGKKSSPNRDRQAHKPRRTASPPGQPPVRRYIESSALVAALLEGDKSALASIRAKGQCITSALTTAETSRAILRARMSGRITPAQERAALLTLRHFTQRAYVVSVTSQVLVRSGQRFPVEPVRTLDAIHLATAEIIAVSPALVTIVTRDARIRDNATALGFPIE